MISLILTLSVALVLALALYLIVIYNNLISLNQNIAKNWSNIEILLKQRYSEIPKLIDACTEYMQYESETLTKIVDARKSAESAAARKDLISLGQAESTLHSGLTHLFALAENYPTLKTNEVFQKLQKRISELESDISDRRELYNTSVNLNNIRIQQFPDILVARSFHFKSADLMKFSEAETEDPNIRQKFQS